MIPPTRHLDLGCGFTPRNPLGQSQLFGCDLLDIAHFGDSPPFEYKRADLVRSGIPYPDSHFDSVSAFDFVEHVPRHSVNAQGDPIAPFISLMNEIYRVLLPNGLFIASTPAFPYPEAFQDPTHVNIITIRTHEYFCGDEPYAARYGFTGRFHVKRVEFEPRKNIFDNESSRFRKTIRKFNRRWLKRESPSLTWELIAKK